MQVTTTSIRHKRYSTYGWNLKENNIYKNTLSQGEIGVLLGYKHNKILPDNTIVQVIDPVTSPITEEESQLGKSLNSILEVRIGTEDGQYFFDSLLISKDGGIDHSIKQVTQLPSWGKSNCLYILTTNNTSYRWDEESMSMIPLMGSGNTNIDLSDYYTKEEIDKLITYERIDGGGAIPTIL